MNKKPPITKAESAKLLAKFIVDNWHHCPIREDVPVEDCDCWGSENCYLCIRKHADQLGG